MEAIEFSKEYCRMCKTYHYCDGCPLSEKGCLTTPNVNMNLKFLTKIIKTVEKWSNEHPIKNTNEIMIWHDCKTDPPKKDGKYVLVYKTKIGSYEKIEWQAVSYSTYSKKWRKSRNNILIFDENEHDLIKWAEVDLSNIK